MEVISEQTVIELHAELIHQFGGSMGLRDGGALASAVARPPMTLAGTDLHPAPVEKTVALGYSLIMNHPFVDGNKRVGLECHGGFLKLHGWNIVASDDEKVDVALGVASGTISRQQLVEWVQKHLVPRPSDAANGETSFHAP